MGDNGWAEAKRLRTENEIIALELEAKNATYLNLMQQRDALTKENERMKAEQVRLSETISRLNREKDAVDVKGYLEAHDKELEKAQRLADRFLYDWQRVVKERDEAHDQIRIHMKCSDTFREERRTAIRQRDEARQVALRWMNIATGADSADAEARAKLSDSTGRLAPFKNDYAEGQESAEPASAPPHQPRETSMRPRGDSGVKRILVCIDEHMAMVGEGRGFMVDVHDLPCSPYLLDVGYECNKQFGGKHWLRMDFVAWDWKDWRRFTHRYALVNVDGYFPDDARGHVVVTDDAIGHIEFSDDRQYYLFPFKQTIPDPNNIKRKPAAT